MLLNGFRYISLLVLDSDCLELFFVSFFLLFIVSGIEVLFNVLMLEFQILRLGTSTYITQCRPCTCLEERFKKLKQGLCESDDSEFRIE